MDRRWILLLPILSGCTANQYWKLDTIQAGEKAFDLGRLVYTNPQYSPLHFEVLCQNETVEAFVFLTKHKLTPSSTEPQLVQIECRIGGDLFIEEVPLLEGRMRLRLSKPLTQQIVSALQEEKKIDILLDGFKQELDPGSFSKLYAKLLSPPSQFANRLKGLF